MALNSDSKIFVAGHKGMVGGAVVRKLSSSGFKNVITQDRSDLDLTHQSSVFNFLSESKPDYVIVAAAKVGGIHANSTYPAEFIYENLALELNLIHGSQLAGVPRLLFLGSSCIYPRDAQQPMAESALLTGPLETTNEAYAIAKIAGLKMCQFYRQQYGITYHSAMPTNLYGPGDNYHPENSHVLPALIRRIHEAKVACSNDVTIWGSGRPLREFLHADDCASAIVHLMQLENPPDLVNVGSGEEISIAQLAELVSDIVGFPGDIKNELSKPDGTPRKLMDSSVLRATGWQPSISIREGIAGAYQDFLQSESSGQVRQK